MRLVFIATGDIALPVFLHLLKVGPKPLALVTQPDKPVGRHQEIQASAIKTAAVTAGIPVLQPQRIGDATAEISSMNPDVMVVMAYGQILKNDILTLPKLAIINLHASLLPKYRGAACIQAAIDAGDRETGITSMHVVRELDAGDMIVSKSISINSDETGGSLHDRLAQLAISVLDETLINLTKGTARRTPQNSEQISYTPKLEREDGKLNWSMPATNLERRIRAYDPWPGTFTTVFENGSPKRLKVFPPTRLSDTSLKPSEISCDGGKLIVGCGDGSLELTMVQPEGGKRMTATDYLRGKKPERFA
jgi:methionyl-tRNA formyltransferase